MARQTGIIQLSGPLGGISFYKHKKYGMLARACNPVSAQRIAQDPAFARTRENGSEFGRVSRGGRLLRNGLKSFLQDIPLQNLDTRVVQLLMHVKTQDKINVRGQRQLDTALQSQPDLLDGFAFGRAGGPGKFLVHAPVVDRQAGQLILPSFATDHIPRGSTHVALTGFRGRIHFEQELCDVVVSERVVVSPGSSVEREVVLPLRGPAGDSGIEIWGLKIVFLQEINGEFVVLQSGVAGILHGFQVANPDRAIRSNMCKQRSQPVSGILTTGHSAVGAGCSEPILPTASGSMHTDGAAWKAVGKASQNLAALHKGITMQADDT